MHTKNRLGRQGLAQKASQTFDNTSAHQNIVKSISNSFLIFSDLQKLPISPYSYSYDFLVSTGLRGHLALKST